ncbi:MAG TPA: response regulator [Nitrospira sp.]|nr:response regulator [Nitrospira sp.]
MLSTIFVIDSSPAVRRMVEQISAPAGYDVIGFQDGPTALEAARKMSPSLIITDYHLDNMTFSGFCKEVHKLDNLSDTYIIALTGATDKFDDSHLKSLGVKAFLKKPFQSEHLLDVIKELDGSASKKKKRAWPPTSSATDSDDDLTDAETADEELAVNIPYTLQSSAPEPKEPPVTAQAPDPAPAHPPAAEPEEAMKGLFGQLLQSMSGKTEQKIAEMLPQIVSTKLETYVTKALEAEMHSQLGTTISQERLTEIVEPLLMRALSKALTTEMAVLEPIIRNSIVEIASPMIREHIDRVMGEQAETVKRSVPDAVREHLRSMEQDIQDHLKQAAAEQTERAAADVIRAVAEEKIQTTVQNVIPSMVEEQIKAEIRRLTQAA